MNETQIDDIYSVLSSLSKNQIIEFIIKLETLNLSQIQDRTIILKYIDMIGNYIKICNKMKFDELEKDLKQIKTKLITHLNSRLDTTFTLT